MVEPPPFFLVQRSNRMFLQAYATTHLYSGSLPQCEVRCLFLLNDVVEYLILSLSDAGVRPTRPSGGLRGNQLHRKLIRTGSRNPPGPPVAK